MALMCAALLVSFLLAAAPAAEPARISAAVVDDRGFRVHEVESRYQSAMTSIRVLLPDKLSPQRRYRAIYVLPVEAGREDRYGDGLAQIKRLDLHNKHALAFVAPSFAQLPWYADHPTDPAIRQETYFLEVVVPFVEKTYPLAAEARGRLLLGFSKSGWGAWTLLLRHPGRFARAAAWDAPLALSRPGRFGSGPIFGDEENFRRYQVTRLLAERAAELDGRLILLGYGGFREDHRQVHAQLDRLGVAHVYRDGPERRHDWHSGWVAEAVELLLAEPPDASRPPTTGDR
jgi:S-formylglutathione hydrolase FrmB